MEQKSILLEFVSSILLLLVVFVTSCNPEEFTKDPSKKLTFSSDTLTFDTIFTTIGSATRQFKIYNPHNDFIRLDKIYLGGGANSAFKMNVDGIPGSELKDIELRPNDSIYVFCEITINPNDPLEDSPFIHIDSILLEYNGIVQRVVLLAWGQNANYYPAKTNKGMVAYIDLQGQTLQWNDNKPYVIYGIVYIDNGTLEIEAGKHIHFWGGITKAIDANGETFFYNDGRLVIGSNANLIVKGTLNLPVVFQSVRLEESFKKIAGQWSGIFFDKRSKGNQIQYANVRNSLLGFYLDSLSEVSIFNSKVFYNSLFGIYAIQSKLIIQNSLFYEQGAESVNVVLGGAIDIQYCTFANFGNNFSAIHLSNKFCLDILCESFTVAPLRANITNSVFSGSDEDEVSLSRSEQAEFDIKFDHCLFRLQDLHTKYYPQFLPDFTADCIVYNSLEKLFKDISNENFRPDTLSVLEKKAKPLSFILGDIDGNTRDVQMPDIGCYEYQY